MNLTEYHAKCYAQFLSYHIADEMQKLALVLSDSQIDLNPHQVEAALFTVRNPLSLGKILADEVGLGKTVESGIIISQKWAEGNRKILIIVPANLRTQWQIELSEKFYLDSIILDGTTFAVMEKEKITNPFKQNCIIITSYHFASAKSNYIKEIEFDLVVIDEAHRLKNVYKSNNVIAKNIQDATKGRFKILATATPLQNSLLELYGLISFIDEYVFGDLESFRQQFLYLKNSNTEAFSDLANRLHTMCIRTLRRQVTEYINYTERLLITQEFKPLPKEKELYDKVSDYLQKKSLWALPSSQRYFVSLILWKQLASSTFAIAGTLHKLITKLQIALDRENTFSLEELEEEGLVLKDYEYSSESLHLHLSEHEKKEIKKEIEELTETYSLAVSIQENAKGKALLTALEKGFQKLNDLGAPKKAVIFTESRRTQQYITQLLDKTKYKQKYCLYFGGMKKKQMEQTKDDFKNKYQIMIATEAAAEGVNLQFCSMIINYDLPWNPQRIEQRIGRCHRYGQKYDVVVINFLNQENMADQRVYELLCTKFKLFEGVFGASDGVLGSLDCLDFEKRMIEVYQQCRTKEEIERKFIEIRELFQESIEENMKNIKQKLLENFDEEVVEKLRFNADSSKYYMNQTDVMLWELTKYYLSSYADFFEDENGKALFIKKNPFKHMKKQAPNYTLRFKKEEPKASRYRLNSPVAENMLFDIRHNYELPYDTITFDWTGHKPKISALESLVSKKGYLSFYTVKLEGNYHKEYPIFIGFTDDGEILSKQQLRRIWNLSGKSMGKFLSLQLLKEDRKNKRINENYYEEEHKRMMEISSPQAEKKLKELFQTEKENLLLDLAQRNAQVFDEEMDKLDKWAKDVKLSMEKNIKLLDVNIKEWKTKLQKAVKLEDKLKIREKIRELEAKRNQQRYDLYEEQDKIDKEQERLIQETQEKMKQKVKEEYQFTIRWVIV